MCHRLIVGGLLWGLPGTEEATFSSFKHKKKQKEALLSYRRIVGGLLWRPPGTEEASHSSIGESLAPFVVH